MNKVGVLIRQGSVDTTKNLKLIKWRWGEGRRDISVALNDMVFYRIMNICY